MTHSPSYPRSYRIIDVQEIIFFKRIQVLSHKKMIGTLQSTQRSIIIDHGIENVIILSWTSAASACEESRKSTCWNDQERLEVDNSVAEVLNY